MYKDFFRNWYRDSLFRVITWSLSQTRLTFLNKSFNGCRFLYERKSPIYINISTIVSNGLTKGTSMSSPDLSLDKIPVFQTGTHPDYTSPRYRIYCMAHTLYSGTHKITFDIWNQPAFIESSNITWTDCRAKIQPLIFKSNAVTRLMLRNLAP